MLITELFDNPAEWILDMEDHRSANYTFSIDEINYDVDFSRSPARLDNLEIYNVNFSIVESTGANNFDIANTGNQYEVFATVMEIMKDFIKDRNVNAVVFSAAASEPSRISLYTKMMPKLKRIGMPNGTIKTNHRNTHYFIAATDKDALVLATGRISMLKGLN